MATEIEIPANIITCPECNEPLLVEVIEWETTSAIPTEAGCYVRCKTESEEVYHDHYFNIWVEAILVATAYIRKYYVYVVGKNGLPDSLRRK